VSKDGATVNALPPEDAATVSVTVVEWESVPDVPVMVIPAVMLAAVLLAVSVSVLVPALLIGLNNAVTPVGRPGGVKLTVLLLKPPEGAIVIVLVALAPGATVTLLGEADKLKFGTVAAVIVRLKGAV
jgi:hypothetical protein